MSHYTYLQAKTTHSSVKRSLVIAGGGMRVAYQSGALLALDEAHIDFEHADGTSGGTINLAMLLSGLSPREMCQRWRSLDVSSFVSFVPAYEYLKAHDMLAMGDADGIIEEVFPSLGIDLDKIRQKQGIKGSFNVCNFSRKTNEVISNEELSLDLLIAGISLPVFMPPMEVNNQLYCDSVWIKDANLMEAVKRGAEELWLIWCIGNTPDYQTGLFNQYVHMIELSANGGLFEEFAQIRQLNERIIAGDSPYGQTSPIRLHVLKPKTPLPLDPDLYLARIDCATLICMGYADTKAYLASMQQTGVALCPEATLMQTQNSIGISFRESMAGGFSLGHNNPLIGAEQGNAQGGELSIHVAIKIADIEAFTADPMHQGELHGMIDFLPFANGIPATKGLFNLFSPGDDSDTTYMIYELAFEHEGQTYYLAGKKEIRDDPGYDLWEDTTSLFTTLHRGQDKQAPIIGAGVLRLGIKDLIQLGKSMHVSNAKTMQQKVASITTFGRFFMGELWASYARFFVEKTKP